MGLKGNLTRFLFFSISYLLDFFFIMMNMSMAAIE
jgi:hypothetical protein